MSPICLTLLAALPLQEFEGTHSDPEKRFTIPLPKGWTVEPPETSPGNLVLRCPAEDRTGATLILHVAEPMKAVSGGQVSLDTFIKEVKKRYPEKFKDFEWIKARKGGTRRIKRLSLYYRYTSGDQKVHQLQHLAWTRKHHYSLTWGCRDDAFEKYRELFEAASKKFRPAR